MDTVLQIRLVLTFGALALAACMPPYTMTGTMEPDRTCPDGSAGTVDWYFPTERSDNAKLERWCVTLGPVVIDSTPAAPFGSLGAADSLAIASWNVDAGAGDVMSFLHDQLRITCDGADSQLQSGGTHFVFLVQEALRRSLDIPDVEPGWAVSPAVKEAPRPGDRLDIVEVAEQCGLSIYYTPGARNGAAMRKGKREEKGEAILSTLPLSDFIAMELPYEAARRVVPAATVHNVRGDSLRLASVHLITTPPAWRILVTASSSRLRQALSVVDALSAVEAARGDTIVPSISTIVAGDLNTWSTRETTLLHLTEHFPESPPLMAEPTRGPYPTDHLLFRARRSLQGGPDAILAGTYRRVAETYYSDHTPIVAWFRFGR